MHITGWTLQGFGHFQDLRHEDLPPGLLVVYGPNEAGKSTLLAFLLFVLFGRERGRRVQALAGGRTGGRVELVVQGRPVTVERFEDEPPVVWDAGQRLVGEEALARLLGGTDRRMFQSIYAFSLADLTSLDGLGDAAARERLFAGAVAGAGRSVAEARRSLLKDQEKLWRTRADCSMRATQGRLHAVEADLAKARHEAAQADAILRALEQARHTRLHADTCVAQARARQQRALAWIQAWPHACEARLARDELAELHTQALLESAPAERLRDRLEAVARREQQHASATDATLAAQARLERIAVDVALLDAAGQIDSLAAGLDAVRADRQTLARLAMERPGREADLHAALQRSGLPSPDALAQVDLAHARVAALRQAAEAVREERRAQQTLRSAQETAARETEDRQRRCLEVQGIARDEVAESHAPRLERLLARHAEVLATRTQLRDRRAALEQAAHEEEAALRSWQPAQEEAIQADAAQVLAVRAAAEAWRTAQAQASMAQSSHEVQVQTAAEAEQRARHQLDAVQVPVHVLEAAERIQALESRAGHVQVAQAVQREADRAADEAEREAERALQHLGAGWSLQRAWAVQTGETVRAQGLRLAEAVRRADQRAGLLRDQVQPPSPSTRTLDQALAHLEAVQAALVARETLDRAVRDRDAGRPTAGRGVAALILALALLLLVLGVVLALRVHAGFGVGIAALALACALLGAWLLRPTAQDGTASDVERWTRAATERLQAAGLPLDADALVLTTARQQAEVQVRTAERAEGDSRLRRQWQDAQAEAATARDHYVAWCARAGMPEDTAPDDLGERLATLREVCSALQKAADLRQKARQHEAEVLAWTRDRDDLARRLGGEAGPGLPPGPHALAELTRTLRHAEEARRQQEARRSDLARAREVREDLQRRGAQVQQVVEEAARAADRARGLADALGIPSDVAVPALPGWLDARERVALARTRRQALADEVARLEPMLQRWEDDLTRVRTDLDLAGDEAEVLHAATVRCESARTARQAHESATLAWQAAAERVDRAGQAVIQARVDAETLAPAHQQWHEARTAARLPDSVGPETLDTALTLTEVAQKHAQDLQTLRTAADQATRRIHAFLHAAQTLARHLGRTPAPDAATAIEQVRLLDAARREAQAASERRAIAEEEVAKLQAGVQTAAHRLQEARAELHEALAAHGLQDPEAIREAVDRATRAAACRERLAVADTALRGLLGGAAGDPDVQARLATGDLPAWQAEAALAAQQADEAGEQGDQASAQIGRLEADLERLGAATDIPDLDAQRARLREEQAADRHRLAVLTLADHLLGRTLVTFRERHAPGVFRIASEHLRTATAGIYDRVEATEDHRDLRIHDRDHGTRAPEDLSRGTKDLLYFTLRLGLAREQQPGGQTLPLVLDDVLVNLDPQRAEGVCRVLVREAATRQVVLLTCRPETVALVRSQVAELSVVTLDRFAGRPLPARPPARLERGARVDLDVDKAVLAVLQAGDWWKRADISQRAGLDDAAVLAALTRLRGNGSVRVDGQKKGMRYAVVQDVPAP